MTGKQLKNSILQWAIQGKLVPQDPNDEPASVLLERIRAEKARLVKEGKIKKDKNESIIFRGEDNSYYEKFTDGRVVCINDEIPFEIPSEWEWVRLGHVANVIGGYAFPSQTLKGDNGPRVIRISDINESGFVNSKIVRYNGPDISSSYSIQVNDILMAMTGGTVGKSLFVSEIPEKMLLNQRVAIIRNQWVIAEYLNLVLKAPHVIAVINERKNSTNDNISMVDIYNFLVPMPVISEQKKIINTFDSLLPEFEKYDFFQTELDKLDNSLSVRIRKTFLQEAIQGKLVPQDPNDEPASILLGRIKEEKLRLVKEGKLKKKDIVDSVIYKGDDNKYYEKKGKEIKCVDEEIPFDIPQSWEWSRLGYIIELKSGQDLTPDRYTSMEDGIPYITGASNFENKNIKLNRWTTTPTSIAYPGELLITCKGTVGAMAYNNTCTPFHIARQIMSIHSFIAEIGYIERYLEFSISTLEKAAHSIIPGISRETILQAIIPLPPLNEQKRILDSINTLFKCIK